MNKQYNILNGGRMFQSLVSHLYQQAVREVGADIDLHFSEAQIQVKPAHEGGFSIKGIIVWRHLGETVGRAGRFHGFVRDNEIKTLELEI